MTKEYKYTGTWAELIGMLKWVLTTMQADKDGRSDFLEIARTPSLLTQVANEYGITDHMIMKLIVQCANEIEKDTGYNLRALDETQKQLGLLALAQAVARQEGNRRYSIGMYQEGAVCIECSLDGCVVYEGECHKHYNEAVFDSVGQAGEELINRIAANEEVKEKMINEYVNLLAEYTYGSRGEKKA